MFTMAALQHIHPDSEWVFPEIVRITDTLITVEDEVATTWLCFSRNYKAIFEKLGMKQIEALSCANVPGLSCDYIARVFGK